MNSLNDQILKVSVLFSASLMKKIRRFRNIFYKKLYASSRLLDISILSMHSIFRFNYEKK